MIATYTNTLECNSLLQESLLCASLFEIGSQSLISACPHSATESLFYSSFFNLSISLERFLKIALCTEYFSNNLEFPSGKYLRSKGHKIIDLYNYFISESNLTDVSILNPNTQKSESYQLKNMTEDEHQDYDLFYFFNVFADQTRYYNLNQITQEIHTKGYEFTHPLNDWRNLCQEFIIDERGAEMLEGDLIELISKCSPAYSIFSDYSNSPLLESSIIIDKYLTTHGNRIALQRLKYNLKPIAHYLTITANLINSESNPNAQPLPDFKSIFNFFNDN